MAGLREGELQVQGIVYEPSLPAQRRLTGLLGELGWTCRSVDSLEDLSAQCADAWALVAEVTPKTQRYFEHLTEGFPDLAVCALVARADVTTIEHAADYSRWRIVEKPYTDDLLIDELARALLDKS